MEIEQPKIVKKKLFSPIWLLPLVALALGGWLGIKSIREAGIEITVHFPSATGIDIGKTLVRYEGLTVGKVMDISVDDNLQGVNVDITLDYRSERFLKEGTKFWLVTPKASLTGVEGLDALFSGNYIGMQIGEGEPQYEFTAEREPPVMLPNIDGMVIELSAERLGSLSIGSAIFYRQIPVGSVISYRLKNNNVLINAFIEEQYAHLVKDESRFWNVSGVEVNASLSGVEINAESLSTILAGGITFTSPSNASEAKTGDKFTLYSDKNEAQSGANFTLTASQAEGINKGTKIYYRGLIIGEIDNILLDNDQMQIQAHLNAKYSSLLGGTAQFWRAGADISLNGVKNAARLISGDVINFLPGTGEPKLNYVLADKAPSLSQAKLVKLQLKATENPGISSGAKIRYKKIDIGTVNEVKLDPNFNAVIYQATILPEFTSLLTQGSDFVAQAPLNVDASIDGVKVSGTDLTTLTKGSVNLRRGNSNKALDTNKQLNLFASVTEADRFYEKIGQTSLTLYSDGGANLSQGSPVYYKKMQIGKIDSVNWLQSDDKFKINLTIDKTFKPLLTANTVFWRNQAVSIDAKLSGLKVDIAPLNGAIKGSISLGLLSDKSTKSVSFNNNLYQSQALALNQSKAVELSFPAKAPLQQGAAVRYQGYQIGEIAQITLSENLDKLNAKAYLYGKYAGKFMRSDSQYSITQAEFSLKGIKAPETILTGAYVNAIPGKSISLATQFTGKIKTAATPDEGAMLITLTKPNLGSIKVGTGIFFRGIKIGEVISYSLAALGDQVFINTQILAPYRHIINQSSRFYDLSGVKIDFGLFSGAQIKAGSLENILSGGIGVVTQEANVSSNAITEQVRMKLYNEINIDWLDWQPLLK